jgi:hypothetical protein
MFPKQADFSVPPSCHLPWRSTAVRTVTGSNGSPYGGSLSHNPPERTRWPAHTFLRLRGVHLPHAAVPLAVRTVRTATHAVCFGTAQRAKLQLCRQRFLSGPRPRTARNAQVATLHQNRIPTARP